MLFKDLKKLLSDHYSINYDFFIFCDIVSLTDWDPNDGNDLDWDEVLEKKYNVKTRYNEAISINNLYFDDLVAITHKKFDPKTFFDNYYVKEVGAIEYDHVLVELTKDEA